MNNGTKEFIYDCIYSLHLILKANRHISGLSIQSVCQFSLTSAHPAVETPLPTPLASPVSTSHLPALLPPTSLLTPSPQPQPLGSSSRQANWLGPRRGGSCHISNLAPPLLQIKDTSLWLSNPPQPPPARPSLHASLSSPPFLGNLLLYFSKSSATFNMFQNFIFKTFFFLIWYNALSFFLFL